MKSKVPSITSITLGRIHGEFLRLLYILAHRRTTKYFASLGDDEPGVDAFTWRRSQFFWQHWAAIGLANAVADARRAHLAHPARRLRAHPSPLDPLLSQPPPLPLAHSSALLLRHHFSVWTWHVRIPLVDGV